MKRFTLISSAMFFCLAIAGCPLTEQVQDNQPNTDRQEAAVQVDSTTTFNAFADAVKSRTCHDTATLARLVKLHERNGWLDSSAVQRFDQAFPDAGSKQRELTDEDAKTLRSMGAK